MTSKLVIREDYGAVSVLTLNRPDKRNALSPALFEALRFHVDALAMLADDIRVIVIRGAGPSFCGGADLTALREGVVTTDPEFRSRTIEKIGALPQTIIAAVHGHCVTGGLELALAADFIIASENAVFRDTHAALGIVPRWGMSARLPRRVGLTQARWLSTTGIAVDARQALVIGLCEMITDNARHMAAAMEIAQSIAANSVASIRAISHLYETAMTMPVAEALDYERIYTPAGSTRPE